MTVSLVLLGHPVDIHSDDPRTEGKVRSLLEDLLAPSDSERAVEPERITIAGPASEVDRAGLMAAVDEAVVRLGSGHLMPRAAAVARPDGAVALLGGEPGSSSLTDLVTALVQRGCTSLSERTSVLEPDTLEVLPV